jgi:hypothetical protein
MKLKLFLLPSVLIAFFSFPMIPACRATIITFDDILHDTGVSSLIANGYQGLVWSNFSSVNAVLQTNDFGLSGYYYGMVSASNVAFDASGNPAEIDSTGATFNFLSVYLTGAWNSNLNVEVEGFRGGSLMYDQIVTVAATNATQFAFDYMDIDRLYFSSSGGQGAGFSFPSGRNFAMDNFDFEFVPEPSSFLLTLVGVLALWSLRKRRRA